MVAKKKNKINPISIIVLVLIAGFLFFGFTFVFLGEPTVVNQDDLGKCLVDANAKFYGAEWCGHCKTQKDMLGTAFTLYKDKIYVDCDLNQAACAEAQIRGTPTWAINGKKLQGVQTLENLANAAGCPEAIRKT